ncbi:MAG: protein-glutamate O-methyltransferase CheR [Bacteroidales bacterium]|nr:protein-glutamate O-methyltransferase CheR [Bacteroidales bacterium]
MNKRLKEITTFLLMNHGIDISFYEEDFLIRSLDKRLIATNTHSYKAYSDYLRADKKEIDFLANSLHISYSEFFRNPLTFSILEYLVLPSLLEKKKLGKEKEIRVWSAACASGQETYSFAMILDEIMDDFPTKFSYRIFATDINEKELSKARIGAYYPAALNNVTYKRFKKYFTKQDETYIIVPRLMENIDFSVFNLLTEKEDCPPVSIYGNFDFIFCSNVLFYYNTESQSCILERLSNSLAPGGLLITGDTERNIVKEHHFSEVYVGSGIFKKKNDGLGVKNDKIPVI